jgi:hypothetical protein
MVNNRFVVTTSSPLLRARSFEVSTNYIWGRVEHRVVTVEADRSTAQSGALSAPFWGWENTRINNGTSFQQSVASSNTIGIQGDLVIRDRLVTPQVINGVTYLTLA